MKMKAPQIHQTQDYSLFVDHEFQRPMSQAHIKNLMHSMRKYGYFPSEPIAVYKTGKKLTIIEGHNRKRAAELLGIPIPYVIEPERNSDSIGERNYAVRKWNNQSFVNLYAGKGSADYIILLEYMNKGISLSSAASLLRGESAHSGNYGVLIRSGGFTVKTTRYCDMLVNTFEQLGDIIPVIKKQSFVEAISMLFRVDDFDLQTFWTRAKANPRAFAACAKRQQALELIEDVYNFRARDKVNLAFLAQEAMRMRNIAAKSEAV